MKREEFINLIKDYFTFNRMEQRGIFVLLTVFFLVVVARSVVPLVFMPGNPDMSGFEKEVAAFERSVKISDSLEVAGKKNNHSKFNSSRSSKFRDSTGKFKPYPKEVFVIELNSADTFDLQRLKGIGPAYARMIVNYRKRLHGFTDKSQLLEIWGMDTLRYNAIHDYLTVNPDSVHPLNLNKVTFKEMISHPYFPFETTKAIMLYRKDHKKFGSVNELKNIKTIPDSTFRKIWRYVKVE